MYSESSVSKLIPNFNVRKESDKRSFARSHHKCYVIWCGEKISSDFRPEAASNQYTAFLRNDINFLSFYWLTSACSHLEHFEKKNNQSNSVTRHKRRISETLISMTRKKIQIPTRILLNLASSFFAVFWSKRQVL